MNQKVKPTSSYMKQTNSYARSPRLGQRVFHSNKSTSTSEKYASSHVRCQDQDCQTDPVEEPLQRDYMEALKYINECHDVINQMYQQNKGNLRVPEVPNFIDLYMRLGENRRNLIDIANQDLIQQNISQTHCTLIDSLYDGSVNTNNNDQGCSSPESDYDLLAEPMLTYTKKQEDIKRANRRLSNTEVLRDSCQEEVREQRNSGPSEERNNNLDILYENNFRWKVSDYGKIYQKQTQNTADDVENKSHEMTSAEFENIIEELAHHVQQKCKRGNNINNIEQAHNIEMTSNSVPPMKCNMERSLSPCNRRETHNETYDSPNGKQDQQYETRRSQRKQSSKEFELPYQNSNCGLSKHQQSAQCCHLKNSQHSEVPASKLLQKSPQNRDKQECQMRQSNGIDSNIRNQNICQVRETNEKHIGEEIPFFKASKEIQSPNAFNKLIVCKKKHSKEMVEKQCSDSDIDDEYYQEEHMPHLNKNKQRNCVNATEERGAVIQPNRTELISTVKYGRRVVMRTGLSPSKLQNFRQHRQSDEQLETKCGGDSSDISSDPEFLMRQ